VTPRLRTIAFCTSLFFAVELVALPCGTACHQTEAEHQNARSSDSSSEHACHEAPVREGVTQIAGIPSACTHQHDVPDFPRTSASIDRDHLTALIPAFVLLPSHEDVVHVVAALSPQPRDSISLASLSLRI
jgi:hypothetical protein